MAAVQLIIGDPAYRLTMRAMLEAEGHRIVASEADVIISDDTRTALDSAKKAQTLFLCPVAHLAEAVEVMKRGVFGYIVLPFVPGEAGVMVARALQCRERTQDLSEPRPESMEPLETIELRYMREVLRRCKGNQAKAARILGIGRNTLWRKLKAAGEQDAG